MKNYFTLIDRYFIQLFLWTTLAVFGIVTTLFILITLFLDLDGLFQLFDKYPGFSGVLVLFQFYTVRIMTLLQVLGMGIIMSGAACTFYLMERSTSLSTRGGETFPVLNSGLSRWRIAIPFTFAGIFLILLMHGGLELFFVHCTDWPGTNSKSFLPKSVVSIREKRDPASGIEFKGRSLDLDSGVLLAPKLIVPSSITNSYIGILMAETATWMPANESHPAGYLLEKLKNPENETWLQTTSLAKTDENQIFYLHENSEWVPEGAIFVVSVIQPVDLNASSRAFLPDSLPELIRKLGEPTNEVQYATSVQIHSRITRPLLDISLWFLMIPVMLSGRILSKLTVLVWLIVLFGIYMAVPQIFNGFGENGLILSFLAVWIPVFLFSAGATVLFEQFHT